MDAKINSLCLENFLVMMEQGYSKHGNPYHNLVHAADVTQTTHAIITDSGLNVCHYTSLSYYTLTAVLIMMMLYLLHRNRATQYVS